MAAVPLLQRSLSVLDECLIKDLAKDTVKTDKIQKLKAFSLFFHFLPARDLSRAGSVCQSWWNFMSDDAVWLPLCQELVDKERLTDSKLLVPFMFMHPARRRYEELKRFVHSLRIKFRDGACRATNIGHTGGLCHLAVTDRIAATISFKNPRCLEIWELDTGLRLQELPDTAGFHTCVDALGDTVVSGGSGAELRVWLVQSVSEPLFLRFEYAIWLVEEDGAYSDRVGCVKLFPAAGGVERTAVCGAGANIHVVRLESRSSVAILQGHSAPLFDIGGDETLLVSAAFDETIRTWDRKNQRCLRIISRTLPRKGPRALSIQLPYFAASMINATIQVWDARTGA